MELLKQICVTVLAIVPLPFLVTLATSGMHAPPIVTFALQSIVAGIVFVIYFRRIAAENGGSKGKALGRAVMASFLVVVASILEWYYLGVIAYIGEMLFGVKFGDAFVINMMNIYFSVSIAFIVTITCKGRWDKDRKVTAMVVIAWLLVVAIPSSLLAYHRVNEQKIQDAKFTTIKPKLTETVMRAYQAVHAGDPAAFEEVVEISHLNVLQDIGKMSKENVLQAIKEKKFLDATTPYGIKIFRWVLVDVEDGEDGFLSFKKNDDEKSGWYADREKSGDYLVKLAFQANSYKKSIVRVFISENGGNFRITFADMHEMRRYEEKLEWLNSPEIWNEADLKGKETLKWKLGEPLWVTCQIPVEIETTRSNLKSAYFAAQIVEVSTGEVVDMLQITTKDSLQPGGKITIMGKMDIDHKAVQLIQNGRLAIGRVVPSQVTDNSTKSVIVFFEKIGSQLKREY